MVRYNIQNLDAMVAKAWAALQAGETDELPLIDGRVVAVFASPNDLSSEDMALGKRASACLFDARAQPSRRRVRDRVNNLLHPEILIEIEASAIIQSQG